MIFFAKFEMLVHNETVTILLGHGFDEPATLRFVPIGLADMYGIYSIVEQPADGRNLSRH